MPCKERPAFAWPDAPSESEQGDLRNHWRSENEPSEAAPVRSYEAPENWAHAVLLVLTGFCGNPHRYLRTEWGIIGKAVECLRALELSGHHGEWTVPEATGVCPRATERHAQVVRADAESSAFQSQLDEIYRLSLSGKVHAAGDVIFDLVQELLRRGDFPACDRLLSMVDVTRLEPALMITFLATTLTARDRLRARDAYFSRVLARLTEQRGEDRATRLLHKYR